jgi:hypothetical protein
MKFDGNIAWKQASAQVSANRDVLIALSGVFFLVPSLALALLLPQPAAQTGMTADQMIAGARAYYLQAAPFIIPVLLLQAVGTLTMLTLFTDRDRPTVGESIRRGVTGVVPYLISQILLGIGTAIVAMMLGGVAAATGLMAVVAVAFAVVAAAAIYIAIRMSMVAPVVAVEGVRNPIAALVRSWRLTAGNVGRIALFYLLIAVAFIVIVMIVSLLSGIVIALVTKGDIMVGAQQLVKSMLGAALTVYLVAILAAVHRQVAGPSANGAVATFE